MGAFFVGLYMQSTHSHTFEVYSIIYSYSFLSSYFFIITECYKKGHKMAAGGSGDIKWNVRTLNLPP